MSKLQPSSPKGEKYISYNTVCGVMEDTEMGDHGATETQQLSRTWLRDGSVQEGFPEAISELGMRGDAGFGEE